MNQPSQVINLQPDDEIHLKVKAPQMAIIMEALSYLPYKQAAPIIADIEAQTANQFNE